MASIPYQYLSNPRYDVGNQDQILEELQAAFIQEIFVKELFFEVDPLSNQTQHSLIFHRIFL